MILQVPRRRELLPANVAHEHAALLLVPLLGLGERLGGFVEHHVDRVALPGGTNFPALLARDGSLDGLHSVCLARVAVILEVLLAADRREPASSAVVPRHLRQLVELRDVRVEPAELFESLAAPVDFARQHFHRAGVRLVSWLASELLKRIF